jgi:DNA-binding transcriptional regulator YdaS (Cro superfamily)
MDLKKYIDTFPRYQRTMVRDNLAKMHDVTEVTVRSWANGTRRHPFTKQAIEITERYTDGEVTRHDLRPDVFGELTAKLYNKKA